jgi:O-antigen ligase
MNEKSTSFSVGAWSGFVTFFVASIIFCSTFTIAGTQISLTAALVLWLSLFVSKRAMAPQRIPLDVPLLVFASISIVSVLLSGEIREGFWNLRNYLLIGVIYLITATMRDSPSLRRLSAVLLVSAGGSALYGTALFVLGRGDGTLGRTSGSFSNAMTFGGVMLMLCSLCFALAIARGVRGRSRVAFVTAAALTATALFFSFTRSSWLGMLVSASIALVIQRRRLLPLFLGGLVMVVLLLPADYRARFTSVFDLDYRTNVQRLEMLEGGWRIFKEHPIIGVGPIDLSELYERHKPPEAQYVFGHLHNNLLNIAVTLGAVGLAAFVYLFVSIFRIMARNLRLDLPPPERAWVVGSVSAVAGFLANGLFEWNFADAEVVTLLYIIVGSNCAIGAIFSRTRHGGRDDLAPALGTRSALQGRRTVAR